MANVPMKAYAGSGGAKSIIKAVAKRQVNKKRYVAFKKSYSQTPSMGDGGGGIGG